MPEAVLIRFEATRLSDQDLVDRTQTVATNMALPANATLVTGLPYTPAQFQTLVTTYKDSRQAVLDNKTLTSTLTHAKHLAELALEKAAMTLVRALEGRPALTEADVLALGFDLRDTGGPPAIVPPQNLSATFGDVAGSISLHWRGQLERGLAEQRADHRVELSIARAHAG